MKTWLSILSIGLFSLSMAHADMQTLEKNLKTNYPDMPAKSVQATPVTGIYEVYMGGRIVYTNEQGKYFFVGNLIDLPTQNNITEQRMQVLTAIDTKQLPLKQAIKHVKGDGSRVLYVFSDPDCPYCQKLDVELAKLNNVTIYLFMFPLTQLHPQAAQISRQVWCSKDQYKAWTDYTLNQIKPTAKETCSNPIQDNIKLAEKLEINGTPTIFLKDGRRVSRMSAEAFDKILNEVK